MSLAGRETKYLELTFSHIKTTLVTPTPIAFAIKILLLAEQMKSFESPHFSRIIRFDFQAARSGPFRLVNFIQHTKYSFFR